MADNVDLTNGSATGGKAALDEVNDATLGVVKVQYVKLMTGTIDGTDKAVVGSNGALAIDVKANAVISTVNSSVANLAAAAVFTGTSEEVSEYSAITVSVFASHASATDGLSMQQSSDGTNWDLTDIYTIPAATGKTFSIAVGARFFRLVYTNGATLTTSLRIQTIYSKGAKKGSSIRPQDARTNDNDFEEVATYLNFYNGASWDRARGSIANGLAVDVTRQPPITKGTQGTTGVSVQDLKDGGRAIVNAATAIAGVAGNVTEAMLTLQVSRDGAAPAGVTTIAVTSGKRFRVTGIMVGLIATTAAVFSARVSLRFNPTGAAIATSPIILTVPVAATAAVAQTGGSIFVPIPDGIEFSGANQVGLSMVAFSANGTIWASLVGFEY